VKWLNSRFRGAAVCAKPADTQSSRLKAKAPLDGHLMEGCDDRDGIGGGNQNAKQRRVNPVSPNGNASQ
jgi:hypothetical protein